MSRVLRILIVIVLFMILYLLYKYRQRMPRRIEDAPGPKKKLSRTITAGGVVLFALVIAYLAISYHEWFRWSMPK